jgi:hypothetical protein
LASRIVEAPSITNWVDLKVRHIEMHDVNLDIAANIRGTYAKHGDD